MDERIVRVLDGRGSDIEVRRLEQDPVHREARELWHTTEGWADIRRTASPPPPALLRRRAEERRRRRRWMRRLPALAGAAVLATAALIGGPWTTLDAPPTNSVATLAAPVDGPRTVALGDGSLVRLAAGATVTWSHTDDARELRLEGRAFFAVARDERPFRVRIEDTVTEVLGTRFEVAAAPDGSLRVVVVEGRVRVRRQATEVEAARNQVVRLPDGGAPRLEAVADALALLDWPEGVLLFRDTPLARVADEVTRQFGRAVSVPDGGLADRRVTAWFEDEDFEQVMAAVCRVVDAECHFDGGGVVVR